MTASQGFLLGLSSGLACTAFCAPLLVPYLLGSGRNVLASCGLVARFLIGRLAGYLSFAVIAWFLGRPLAQAQSKGLITGLLYIGLGVLLVLYALRWQTHAACRSSWLQALLDRTGRSSQALIPWVAGLVTGLSLCPPFLTALATTAVSDSIVSSLVFFAFFFLGTSLFIIPAPLINVGAVRNSQVLVTIGRMAAGIVGLSYLYSGIVMSIT